MMNILSEIIKNPTYYLRVAIAIVRGSYYIAFYRVTKRNVIIRFPLIAFAKLSISGPGKVFIGKRCVVAENVFRGLSIVTLTDKAIVHIEGTGSMLAGLTIRCSNKVSVGRDSMTAVSLIQDCDFVCDMSSKQDLDESKAISVGKNVWIGGLGCILKGSKIGDNSVLAAGSLLSEHELSSYSLGSGSPVKRGMSIERLLAMRN